MRNFLEHSKKEIRVACGKMDDYIQAIFVVEQEYIPFPTQSPEVVSTLAKFYNDTRNDN